MLTAGLVERDVEARLLLLAALAGEHLLFLGPPGTAKSELSRRLHAVLGCNAYFERLLTRFSVPEEIFGPLSMRALEQDRYVRHTEGYLPQAEVAFVDEIFKANSAILNTLLTLLNERLFDNGSERRPAPLLTMVAASNELPESEELDALYDRFLLRCNVTQVSAAGLANLLAATGDPQGRRHCAADRQRRAPPGPGVGPSPEHPVAVAPTAALSMHEVRSFRERALESVRVPRHVVDIVVDLRTYMQEQLEPPAYVSDRRLVKAIDLMKVAAHANGNTSVSEYDTLLLRHVIWSRPEDGERVADWLLARLAADSDLRQSNYLVSSLFGRTCHALQDEAKLERIAEEMAALKDVLLERLEAGLASLDGGLGELSSNVWVAPSDAAALSTALLPKLEKAAEGVQRTLFELVTLELAVERRVDAVVLANLMPRHWADFIRSTSDVEARDMGTRPYP